MTYLFVACHPKYTLSYFKDQDSFFRGSTPFQVPQTQFSLFLLSSRQGQLGKDRQRQNFDTHRSNGASKRHLKRNGASHWSPEQETAWGLRSDVVCERQGSRERRNAADQKSARSKGWQLRNQSCGDSQQSGIADLHSKSDNANKWVEKKRNSRKAENSITVLHILCSYHISSDTRC